MAIKVCAYCRVSTKDKEQLSSFENQMTYFQREFGTDNGYELIRVYADCGRSGTSLRRPDFDLMIADAGIDKTKIDGDLFLITGKPKFSRILVKNTSRFARNVSSDMLLKTLAKNGVYVDFVDTNLSTERPADIMTLQVLQVLDENESRDKSRKVQFGIQEGIKRGNIHSHGNLYGYKYYPKPENRLEIIQEEADVIRLIFRLYIKHNMGFHRIREYLTEHGILTRRGKPFSERGLRIMLQNETYTGRGVRHKFTNGLIFEKHPTRETGEAVIFETDKVPAIIDIPTFEEAQRLLESKVAHQANKGIYPGKTDFAGKVICGCCGSTYFVSSSDYIKSAGGKVRSYACKLKRTMHRDENGERVMLCNNPNVSERKLNEVLNSGAYMGMIWVHVRQGIKELRDIRSALESRIDKQSAKEVEYAQAQLVEVQERKKKLLELYLSNLFTKEQLDERGQALNDEEADIKAKIYELSKSNDDIMADIAEVDETLEFLYEADQNCHNRMTDSGNYELPDKEDIIAGIEKIVVEPDGRLTVKLKAYEEIDRLVAKHKHILGRLHSKVS